MAGLLDSQNSLQPSNNFVRRRVGRLVEVNDTRLDISLEVAFER